MFRVAALVLIVVIATEASPVGNTDYLAEWNEFKKAHGKSYQNSAEEMNRFNIFIENLKAIEQHNEEFSAGKHTFKLGMNRFGDMTNEEFSKQMNGLRVPKNKKPAKKIFRATTSDNLPDSIDWRQKGYVTDVKDQGNCGSCWAFSATGSLEGQHFSQTGKLISLSEQNLVDCSTEYGNHGCDGGFMDNAFQYIADNNGIDTEISYPYRAGDYQKTCKYNASNIGATDIGFTDIISGDENDLQSAIANVGPISVSIDAEGRKFQFYWLGVYDSQTCKNDSDSLNHGVLVVGYGTTDDGTKYYIVKNSWGVFWGQSGYILMSRDKNNQCGVATAASYPDV